jgi:hypothetical protein
MHCKEMLKIKYVSLGETTVGKLSTSFIYKIRHRGVQKHNGTFLPNVASQEKIGKDKNVPL